MGVLSSGAQVSFTTAATPAPLQEDVAQLTVSSPPVDPPSRGEVALLLHLDDLHPESLPLAGAQVVRIGGLTTHAPGAADPVRQADKAALADALERASAHFGC